MLYDAISIFLHFHPFLTIIRLKASKESIQNLNSKKIPKYLSKGFF